MSRFITRVFPARVASFSIAIQGGDSKRRDPAFRLFVDACPSGDELLYGISIGFFAGLNAAFIEDSVVQITECWHGFILPFDEEVRFSISDPHRPLYFYQSYYHYRNCACGETSEGEGGPWTARKLPVFDARKRGKQQDVADLGDDSGSYQQEEYHGDARCSPHVVKPYPFWYDGP